MRLSYYERQLIKEFLEYCQYHLCTISDIQSYLRRHTPKTYETIVRFFEEIIKEVQ